MTSYQRIAMLALRLIGAIWTAFFVFVWGIYLVEMVFGMEVQRYPLHTVIGNMAYVVFGLLLMILSRPLGRLIARGLDT